MDGLRAHGFNPGKRVLAEFEPTAYESVGPKRIDALFLIITKRGKLRDNQGHEVVVGGVQ
jgi:hypothetical protein